MSTALHTSADPLTTWQRLRSENERIVAPVRAARSGPADARPVAAIFRCADAGLTGETVFGQSGGSLIDVSTWGHVVDAGVLASLEYAVDTLEVPLVVVLGHHDCQAMRAAVRAWDEAALPTGGTRPAIEQIFGSIVRRSARTESCDEVMTAHIVETGLSLIDRSPAIARRIEAGRLGIVCAAVNPRDGRLAVYATVGPVGEAADALLECV